MVVEKIREWKCNKIFLATEDKKIVQAFKQVFGKLCVTFDREYVNYQPGQAVGAVRIDRPNDRLLDANYLVINV